MTDFSYLHEKETVHLYSKTPQLRSELHKYLITNKYKSEDDFYYIDRIDKAEPWQAINLTSIEILLGNDSIHETEEDIKEGFGGTWDHLEISYLLASLPAKNIKIFCNYVFELADHFNLHAFYNDLKTSKQDLLKIFKSISEKLANDFGEPGSEELGILIQSTYPR